MNFNNVCISLHEYFSSKGYGKILLPLSVPICLGSAALKLFSRFISLGNLVTAILFFAFFFSLFMVLSNQLYIVAAMGLGLWAAAAAVNVLKYALFTRYYHHIQWDSVLYCVVYALFAFSAYKKSMDTSHN